MSLMKRGGSRLRTVSPPTISIKARTVVKSGGSISKLGVAMTIAPIVGVSLPIVLGVYTWWIALMVPWFITLFMAFASVFSFVVVIYVLIHVGDQNGPTQPPSNGGNCCC